MSGNTRLKSPELCLEDAGLRRGIYRLFRFEEVGEYEEYNKFLALSKWSIKMHLKEDEKKEHRWVLIMCKCQKRRSIRMPGFAYLPARSRYSCLDADARSDLRDERGGFTLIEILVVVVIIAIAAMIAIPIMTSAASVQIHSAANMIMADLEYAKSMSISRGQRYSVVFDTAADSYQIEDQTGAVIQHPVKKGFDYVIDFRNDGRLDKVDIVDAAFDATSEVKFDYLGSPYNGSNNPLNSGVISLQAGGTTATVTVEPVTGFISIAD